MIFPETWQFAVRLIAPDAELIPLDGQALGFVTAAFVVANARVESLAAIWPGQDNRIIEAKAALFTLPNPDNKIKIHFILSSPIRNLSVVMPIECYSRQICDKRCKLQY